MFKTGVYGILLVFLCSWAPQSVVASTLPADVPINPEAGRGGPLVVPVRLESGEELPFFVDTGTSSTFLDKSLEQKLGRPIDTATFQSWGHKKKVNVYAVPKLYLGGIPLRLSSPSILTDDCQHWGSLAGRPTMGMLGIDCLRNYCIQLDFGVGKIHFLDDDEANKQTWGKAFSIVPLNAHDSRPAVAENLFGEEGPHSLIDSGFQSDGWLMPKYFDKWTNSSVGLATGKARFPNGLFAGDKYPLVRNRPATPWGGCDLSRRAQVARTSRGPAEFKVGKLQPLGLGGGLLGAKVSFQPLGVSCQMSLLGWLGSRRRMSWR